MRQDSRERNVLVLFALGGALALVLSFLVALIPYSRVGEGSLDFSSPAVFLLANPSFLFASTMLLAGFLTTKLQLLPGLLAFSRIRVVSGFILAAAIYPLGLLLGLIASTLIGERGSYVPYVGEISSLGFVVVVAAAAVRVITRRWPPAFWKGILVFCLGVPFLNAAIGYLSLPSRSRSLESFLEVHTVRGLPLLLVVAEIVLALLVGHWFYRVAGSNPAEPG
jgi:hypothetical protein